MKHVFVSYSRRDKEAVAQLIQDLRAVDVDTWHDQALTGGQKWWDCILAEIRACDVFIFALSPESDESEACKSELRYAYQFDKPILPVWVSGDIKIDLLTSPLNQFQITDYRRRDKLAALDLIKAVSLAPPPGPLPDPLPAEPELPVSYISTLKERIDAPALLSPEAQITLLFELEEEVREGRAPEETRELLKRFRGRDELLAKVSRKIDLLLSQQPARDEEPERDEVKPAVPAATKPRVCAKCGQPDQAGKNFCGGCGAPWPAAGTTNPSADYVRRFACGQRELTTVLAELKTWLDAQDFNVTEERVAGQGTFLHIKKRGDWRNLLGMSTALTTALRHSGEVLTVEIGSAQWVDKAAAGAAGMFLVVPLFTAGYGAWEQSQLPDRIFAFIASRLVGK